MRIAFLNRNPFTHPGGDLVMLEAMMEALRNLGVQCNNIYGEWTPETLQPYDLVHIQHINFTWSKYNLVQTWQSRKPFVIVPIFYPTPVMGLSYVEMKEWMENARAVVPLSFTEAREIAELIGYLGPFDVVPHGTDLGFHAPDDATGMRSGVVACNARGDKGERLVEEVCKQLELPFTYLHSIPHSFLPPHLRQARVFVHSSDSDRMSLTVGEALCSGCRVISSCHDRGNEWYPGMVITDPTNRAMLLSQLEQSYHQPAWNWNPNRVARTMTWELAAQRMKSIYERALA